MYVKGLRRFILLLLCLCSQWADAREFEPRLVSLSDTTANGVLKMFNIDGWQFSFDTPSEIKDQRNLRNTRSVDIRRLHDLKKDPLWNGHGFFELVIDADSTLAGLPRWIAHRSHDPIRVWLNGVEILKNGNPSPNPSEEILSRFMNTVFAGIMLREGLNYILVEYSSHNSPKHFTYWKWFEDGIYLGVFEQVLPSLRRKRAFIFGGTVMLLSLLVLIHSYLAIKFRGKYHTYVSLTTFFMLIMAFTTMSDTLIDWTYSYIYFHEFSYVITLVLIGYFFLISIRKIFDLTVYYSLLAAVGLVFIAFGIVSIYVHRPWLNIIHPIMLISIMIYVFYCLWEAKKRNSETTIWIVAAGIIGTVVGSILYTTIYIAFNNNIEFLFFTSVLLSLTAIPIALTFNVAWNYADLISNLETKVQERTAELEMADSYQKRFFANISHEFRTPLTISEGLVSKMLRSEEPNLSKSQHDLSVVKRNMSRLHDMVDQIIDLTKSDQNHLSLRRQYFKADKLASISVESFRSLAEYHNHTFVFKPDAKDGILYVDRSKVEVMINNLISNAIKFTPDGGEVIIKTYISRNHFRLSVEDSGPGIPAREYEAIFERFHRIKRDEADYVEGMGVGLELSRVLARLHSGDIVVDTSYNDGARFTLSLPLVDHPVDLITPVDDDLVERYVLDSLASAENESQFDILLVEDNADMTDYVSDILNEIGSIKTARNGKEALELLETFTPSIIITDLMMPVMGGLELVEAVKNHEEWQYLPVVVLTAKALEEDKLDLLRIGVVDYITKPFLAEQLVLKVRNLLTYHKRRKEVQSELPPEEIAEKELLADKAAAFVRENLQNKNLSVEMIANEFSQSRRSLYRNLQLETGMSPAEFIREVRLVTARSIVTNNKNILLKELSDAVGYKSSTSFRKMYEERFGEHPLE